VELCLKEIALHRRMLWTMAGLMELCGEEAMSVDLIREAGHLLALEIAGMDAWLSRLEKVALGKEEK